MNLPQMIRQSFEKWKTQRCMLVKSGASYREVTWSEFYGDVERAAASLINLGVSVGDRVAILSSTRMEWAVADSGALSAGAITVPIYPSLTAPEIKDLLLRSESKVIFIADADQVEKFTEKTEEFTFLDKIVVFDGAAVPKTSPLPFVSLADFCGGAKVDQAILAERIAARKPEDVATIIFTSGTTGEPKGVMLTHDNIMSNVIETLRHFSFGTSDVHLAHLPLAHIFERMGGYYLMLYAGATIAYAESIQTVAANIAEVRPTVVVTVPRIFEKIYAGIQAKGAEAPGPVKALTFWALGVAAEVGDHLDKKKPFGLGLSIKNAIANALVFKKVRAKMGGRLRFFVSGGAPLSPEIARFFLGTGLPVMEGYGLTETSPVISANTPDALRVGSVGKPLANVKVKIAEDGEILCKGPSIFIGYYKNEEATKHAFTEDGYFMTGDIGIIDADGFLKITDRKKDLIVTAGGKNVAPQKIENILKMDKFISEVMLYGDKRPFLTAIVVPDFAWLEKYAVHKGMIFHDPKDLVKDSHIIDLYQRRMAAAQEANGLPSHETVKKFVLLDHEFSANQGEVTPTLKLRRKSVTSHYAKELEALYEK